MDDNNEHLARRPWPRLGAFIPSLSRKEISNLKSDDLPKENAENTSSFIDPSVNATAKSPPRNDVRQQLVIDQESTTAPKKELILVTNCGMKGFVEVCAKDTLQNVRDLVADEFDDDMLPEPFYFQRADGVVFSHKQEARKRAWDLIGEEITIAERPSKKLRPDASSNVPPARSTMSSVDDTSVHDKNMQQSLPEEESGTTPEKTIEDTTSVTGENNPSDTEPDKDEETMVADAEVVAEKQQTASAVPHQDGKARAVSANKEDLDKWLDDILLDKNEDTKNRRDETQTLEEESEPNEDSQKHPARETAPKDADKGNEIVLVEGQGDPHKIQNEALKKCCSVLTEMKSFLHQNPLFCSYDRRKDLTNEISEALEKSAPNTIVGVLGNTGVGKSSLLNALLEEASVLPTSGSRGCTATVVELRFNSDLLKSTNNINGNPVVYKGEVEFITLNEWGRELRFLIDECSTNEEKTIYARAPDEQRQPDASAAWGKINDVYGHGTMERYTGRPKEEVLQHLFNNQRVTRLLSPQEGSQKQYNSIVVQEGFIDPTKAKELLAGYSKMGTRLRRSKKKWASTFRNKINQYVYRKGNGSEPQTWPLIRKAVLQGPWSVLSTGACLVDLPGVRDANAARAKVAEHYLQRCNLIWVVAPIKRAVDDGTAKELLGEQFRRRLLMDGAYGNVSFICTQTDDCEATEIMRDHQDVAMSKAGRWEKMTDLLDKITAIEKYLNDMSQEEEDLIAEYEEAQQSLIDSRDELEETSDEGDDDVDVATLEALQSAVTEKSRTANEALRELNDWRESNKKRMENMKERAKKLQRKLKCICATVRNEYSKGCLQEDFRAGLKELCRGSEEEDGNGNGSNGQDMPLPEDFEMDVYCISANDYLKIQGIKPSSDGPPNCFSSADDTQIPALRGFVHETTAQYRSTFTEAFAERTSDMLDRMKLICSGAKNIPGGRSARRCQSLFDGEMNQLEQKMKTIADEFRRKVEAKIQSTLRPSLAKGAQKGHQAAVATAESWGSKNRRSRNERGPNKNGLYWSTYQAVIRRGGEYVSGSAGEVNFNAELCDPMEKEFSSDWQRIMDSHLREIITDCEAKVLRLCAVVDKKLVLGFAETGMDPTRLQTMANAATRSCSNALKAAFRAMKDAASSSQRDLNRSLLPLVKSRMEPGYQAAVHVVGGAGKFSRMKGAVQGHTRGAVSSMFDESTHELLQSINNLIIQLHSMVTATVQIIRKNLENVYSVYWDDHSDKSATMDLAQQQKVQECRDKLLPDLNGLRKIQDDAMELLGIEHDEMELDVMAVDTWEQRNAQKMEEAKRSGDYFDLCNSDTEVEVEAKPSAAASLPKKVKTEPGINPKSRALEAYVAR